MAGTAAAKPKAAERIQDAARALFERQGIRATGVEEVCRVAEAAKMSLYRTFPSKDALVARSWPRTRRKQMPGSMNRWPRRRMRRAPARLIEATAVEVAEPGVCGCPMLLAQAEFRDRAIRPTRSSPTSNGVATSASGAWRSRRARRIRRRWRTSSRSSSRAPSRREATSVKRARRTRCANAGPC